jgi:hypothetical protein
MGEVPLYERRKGAQTLPFPGKAKLLLETVTSVKKSLQRKISAGYA